MLSTYLYTIVSVAIVSCISFVGLFAISLREDVLRSYIFLLVSLAIGALLGDALIHLIPEAFSGDESPLWVSLTIIAGILIFFILEKVLHWHHHEPDNDKHPDSDIHPVGRLILVSDGFHNFIDGLIIATSYLVSIELGIATTIAVIAHEIPQEIGDFGVLLYAGYSKMRALGLNFLSALSSILGALFGLMIGQAADPIAHWFVPFAAGGFIYIALADLIPHLPKTKNITVSILQFVAIFIGIFTMVILLVLE